MGRYLEKASSPKVLNLAWKRLRSDKAPWTEHISRSKMENDLVFHILKLSEEMRDGSYVPDRVRFFPVQKGDGTQRIISSFTLRDKLAQRAILTVLTPFGEKMFHPDSFGYRFGHTVEMAFSKVREYMLCGLTWVVDADIESFFDNIPHKPLIKVLKSLIPDREMVALIHRWLAAGTARKGFLCTPTGIPQGAVISPFLCNVYLTSWDNDMAARSLPFVRFADDFLVFSRSRTDAEKAHSYVAKSLKRLGLALNSKKTRVVKCGPNVQFLGRKLPKIRARNLLASSPKGRP
jgi:RNA-directed DNA polymerase